MTITVPAATTAVTAGRHGRFASEPEAQPLVGQTDPDEVRYCCAVPDQPKGPRCNHPRGWPF
jgi:hypothetical protein